MSRTAGMLSLILTLFYLGSTAASAQPRLTERQVQLIITESFQTLCQRISTNNDRSELRQFLVDLDSARRDSGVWRYVNDDRFRIAFDGTLDRIDRAFNRTCRSVNLTSSDMQLMMEGYRRNIAQFQRFLNFLRRSQDRHQSVSKSEQVIIARQAQVSAIVIGEDRNFWERISIIWSVLMPLSRGP